MWFIMLKLQFQIKFAILQEEKIKLQKEIVYHENSYWLPVSCPLSSVLATQGMHLTAYLVSLS